MREEIKERLDRIARDIKRASDELKLDSGLDAQYAARLLSSALSHMDMQLEQQYGCFLGLKEPPPPAEVQESKPRSAKSKAGK